MRLFILALLLFSSSFAFADEMPEIGMDGLLKEVKSHDAKTMVVFWAPWCPFLYQGAENHKRQSAIHIK